MKLVTELLEAEDESAVLHALETRGLLADESRWKYLGNMPNNQSIVLNQQSSPGAALVEKFTNGLDAILLKHCKAQGINPRGPNAPASMADAITEWFGDLSDKDHGQIREIAENNLVLYATGSKPRPSLALYDAGEGQFAQDFPKTFCSLIYGTDDGSYKGAIPFVQGRFNMGGTGVLPFCSEKRMLQLIVSRVPDEVANTTEHEWAFTLFCFFPSSQAPSWRYLVGTDGHVMTAGPGPLALVPKLGAKSGEICAPRERYVPSGTLVKMYDYKAPKSNICGELFRKLEDYLLRPALPMRLVECRKEYAAKVMGNNVWDRLGVWGKNKLEDGFEDGASIQVKLSTGETIPAEVRVFKLQPESDVDIDHPQTGLRALINGQSHAKRDAQFFRTKAVDLEHIAGSMLVVLDCTELGQSSRNALFMSNRETFRDDPLLHELFKKLQKELHDHEGLQELNIKRYEDKIKNAVNDEDGILALEELLQTDPTLADLFGGLVSGKVASKAAPNGTGGKIIGTPQPFVGLDFPTYFRRSDGTTTAEVELEQGGSTRVSFRTDVKNNYFTRKKHRGTFVFDDGFQPTSHLFNGRLTFTCHVEKKVPEGATLQAKATVTDNKGSGPFLLTIFGKVVAPKDHDKPPAPPPGPKPDPKVDAGPSRPNVKEVKEGPDYPPIKIEKDPKTGRFNLLINVESQLLVDAKQMRPSEEEAAVEFVFKYGLALAAMGLLDAIKKTQEWVDNEAGCRDRVEQSAAAISRVIVPLCLSLPKKLPKPALV
ncbi:MAG TPA: hypothetical protein VN612_04035 [Acidobacteriaceae bacterium]|nr:hypothetical protein [Acidobacteriaceae bacterium]